MLGRYWDLLAVQNDSGIRLAIQDNVYFGVFFVVMLASVLTDLRQVHRAGEVVAICECPAGYAARTGNPW